MNVPIDSQRKLTSSNSIIPRSKSNSISSSSIITTNQWTHELDIRLWRAIDLLHIIVMFFSLYTAIIVAILRNELFEQCPLYAKLYLLDNATHFTSDIIDRETVWGSVSTCEFASFAYLSIFVLSFISLWIHIVFRRVLRTERLLRLPIGLLTLTFTLITVVATSIVTDGVIKFCSNSQTNICSSAGPAIFSRSRWKVISLPVGGWLATLSILLNTLVRGFQLFSKPKKSPQTLKFLLNKLMTNRHQNKSEKDSSEYDSQILRQPRDKITSQPVRRYSVDNRYNRELSPELHPYYYPPIPQYRQIEKRSRFQRICCPCLRSRRKGRPFQEPYRPYVVPEEYFHRLDHLKQNGTVPINVCHRHSMHHPIEQQTQTDVIPQRKNIDEISEIPFLGRRRSSVRFEDEIPSVKIPVELSVAPKDVPLPSPEKEEKIEIPIIENDLERNVSFRNNEDDLWTTVTINREQSAPVQSSHFNRLSLENLSSIDTAISNSDTGITAIHVNSKPIESVSSEVVEQTMSSKDIPPPPSKPSYKVTRYRTPKQPLPLSSRSHTTSSEDDTDLRKIKPVEEINAIVTDKYNYNYLSEALKSNVERLKNTFIRTQENQSYYDQPRDIRMTLPSKSSAHSDIDNRSSN